MNKKKKVFFVQNEGEITICHTIAELKRMTGMKRKTIKNLKHGQWKDISR